VLRVTFVFAHARNRYANTGPTRVTVPAIVAGSPA